MGKLKGNKLDRIQRFTGRIQDIFENDDGTFDLWLEYLTGHPIYEPTTRIERYEMPLSGIEIMMKDAGAEEYIDLLDQKIFVYEINYEFASFDVL